MANHGEIERILEWISGWYMTTPDNCPFTREDIRNICRGPMKDVFLEFMVPRFRTDDQIKVIRSNLYLTDVVNNRFKDDTGNLGSEEVNRDEEEINRLKAKLDEIHEAKQEVVRQIAKGCGKLQETNMQMEEVSQKDFNHLEAIMDHMDLMAHRVSSTNLLLDDMSAGQGTRPSNHTGSPAFPGDTSKPESSPSLMTQLKTLYDKSSNLFDLLFLRQLLPHHNNLSSPVAEDADALTSQISDHTHDLSQVGIKPDLVERWNRREQDAATQVLARVEQKCSNVMDPLEALTKEAEMLHIKLMKAHVDIHFKYRQINTALKKVVEQRKTQIENLILNDTNILAQDFLGFIHCEEQLQKLVKCRELAKQFRSLADGDASEDDLLAVISGENNSTPLRPGMTPATTNPKSDRASLGLSDARLGSINKEVLEDMTISLLKSFPEGKSKLQSVVTQCHTLVMEKFPKLSGELGSMIRKMTPQETKNPLDTIDVTINPEVLKQGIFSALSSVPTSNERSQQDALNQLIALQNSLQETRTQCKTLFKPPSSV